MSIRFCGECNNMLHPRENRVERKLEYYCRICSFVEKNVRETCVYMNEIVKDASTKLDVILSDVNKDPTLQRTKNIQCKQCGHNEAVFFQAEQHAKSTALNLVFVCCNDRCGFENNKGPYKWMDNNED